MEEFDDEMEPLDDEMMDDAGGTDAEAGGALGELDLAADGLKHLRAVFQGWGAMAGGTEPRRPR